MLWNFTLTHWHECLLPFIVMGTRWALLIQTLHFPFLCFSTFCWYLHKSIFKSFYWVFNFWYICFCLLKIFISWLFGVFWGEVVLFLPHSFNITSNISKDIKDSFRKTSFSWSLSPSGCAVFICSFADLLVFYVARFPQVSGTPWLLAGIEERGPQVWWLSALSMWVGLSMMGSLWLRHFIREDILLVNDTPSFVLALKRAVIWMIRVRKDV